VARAAKRHIDEIVLHCSATREGQDISVETIRSWHVDGNGWSDIGYHAVIMLDGTLELGRPLHRSGAHVKGHNANTIGGCYIGGVEADGKTAKDTMTPAQEQAFRNYVTAVRQILGPYVAISGHNQYSSKDCPSFDVREKFADIL